MSILDWLVAFFPLAIVAAVGLYAQRYVKSVADFMSANRSAGRYLLCIARGELQAGAVVFVAFFELISHSGFTITWWQWMTAPISTLVGISGFVSYRYRETRAMTLAQFFEIRYNKSFRLFTGLLGFLAGLLNFGIIPAVGARCLVYFLGLPESLTILSITMPTFIPLMAIFLSITVFVALTGGLITVMVINSLEGIMAQVFYLIIIAALIYMFSWHQIRDVILSQPAHHSWVNPFDSTGVKDFNIWLVLMTLFSSMYGMMAWQNASGYNSAAMTAHESRMGNILSTWREIGKMAVIVFLAICAVTYLHHPDFAAQAAQVEATVHHIADPQAQEQMELPIAVSTLLPIGVKGIFCAILLMGIFGGDATHLHSWGSIFVQDVLVPLRKKPFGPGQHLWVLRCAIVAVAVFAFVFGAFFPQTQFILMWWYVTTAVFVGGAGSVIIGGLYWKKGTSIGAWASMLTGSFLSLAGILAQAMFRDRFPLNGAQVGFFASLMAIAVYIIVSLVTHKEDFNMDRMLHRGEYATKKDVAGDVARKSELSWGRLIGFDENFTLGDKWIAGGIFSWGVFTFFVFLIGTVWNLIAPWPTSVWSTFWQIIGVGVPILFAILIGIWFTWGGLRDLRRLFRRLEAQRVNHLDDGTVVNNQNLDEVSGVLGAPHSKLVEIPVESATKLRKL